MRGMLATSDTLPQTNMLGKWTEKTAWAYGWGNTKRGNPSEILKKAEMTVITHEECQMASYDNKTELDVICAEAPNSAPGHGDSGGPLTVEVNGQHVLIGAVNSMNIDPERTIPNADDTISALVKKLGENRTKWEEWLKEWNDNMPTTHPKVTHLFFTC